MDPGSVWLSLLLSLVIFVVLVLVYSLILSPNPANVMVYHPKKNLVEHNKSHAAVNYSAPFAWIREAFYYNEEHIIATSGLDSAVYFIFYQTVLKIFLSGMVLLPVLLCDVVIETTGDGKISKAFNYFKDLSIGRNEYGRFTLFLYVVATYWVSLYTVNLLETVYNHVLDLRAEALMSPEIRPEEFAVLVRDIPRPPRGQSRKEQVDSYFKELFPDSYFGSLVFPKSEKADEIWKQLEGYRKKLARANAIYAQGQGNKPERYRFGLMGEEVDSVNYYNEKVKELQLKLKGHQMVALRGNKLPSALVFFTSRISASCAAQSLINRRVNEWTVTHAPEPRQLLRTCLDTDTTSMQSCKNLNRLLVFVLLPNFMIHTLYLSAFSTLDNLGELFPSLKLHIVDKYATKIILEAFLPQISLILSMGLIAKFLTKLSESVGFPSLSCVERDAAGTYFIFAVVNVIIGVTCFGTLIAAWKDIKKKPTAFVSILVDNLPANATFFITFVAFKSLVINGLELSRLVPLAVFHLKKKYICKTKEDMKEACAPVSLGYARRLPGDMLVFALVLFYSVVSPIILLAGVLYFGIGWIVLRNQVLRVSVPSYETYGKMWPHINNHILASLFLFQVMMVVYFGQKKCYVFALSIICLLMITMKYARSFETRYHPLFKVHSLGVTCKDVMNTKNMEKIVGSFIPPCMQDIEELANDVLLSNLNAKHIAISGDIESKMHFITENYWDSTSSSSFDSSDDEFGI